MTRYEIAMELREPPEAVEDGLRYAVLQLFSVFKSISFTDEASVQLAEKLFNQERSRQKLSPKRGRSP